jgi:hypothetical protein
LTVFSRWSCIVPFLGVEGGKHRRLLSGVEQDSDVFDPRRGLDLGLQVRHLSLELFIHAGAGSKADRDDQNAGNGGRTPAPGVTGGRGCGNVGHGQNVVFQGIRRGRGGRQTGRVSSSRAFPPPAGQV